MNQLSRNVWKRTFRCLRPTPTKTHISLCIRSDWLESLFSSWRNLTSLAIQKCAQRRFRSDCANAQSDLNLRWAHMSEGTFFWRNGSNFDYINPKRQLLKHNSVSAPSLLIWNRELSDKRHLTEDWLRRVGPRRKGHWRNAND